MHYYQKNLGDYYKKAGRLSILQHGVYNLLMDACYDREKFPTREEAIEWVWASSQEEIDAVDLCLRKFFEKDENGRYFQTRIADEVGKYQAFCKKQAEKGKKGGRPKGEKSESQEKPPGTRRVKNKTQEKPAGFENKPEKSLTTNHKPGTLNQGEGDETMVSNSTEQEIKSPSDITLSNSDTRLFSTFEMPTEWLQWACTNGGMTKDQAIKESKIFISHYAALPEDSAYRADWFAVWNKWVLKEHKHGSSKSTSSGKESAAERATRKSYAYADRN